MASCDPLTILIAPPDGGRRSELKAQLEEIDHSVGAEAENAAELIGEAIREKPNLIENDAYRAVQKLANDDRKSLVEVAKAILIAQKI